MANCPHNLEPNKSVFSTEHNFRRAHRERRQAALRQYLHSLGSQQLRDAVLRALRTDLQDLQLRV